MVEDVAGWIFSAMRNRLIDLWRKEDTQKRAGAVELSEDTIEEIVADAGFDPHDALIRVELEEALDGTALRKLAAALEYWMED
jgi:DNA-directed RNA polymerase specialized sigma24 family protein